MGCAGTKAHTPKACTMIDAKANLADVPRWTFTSDSCGYLLYMDGVLQGGASTLGTRTHTSDGRRRHWTNVEMDRRMHRETAQRICDRENAKLRDFEQSQTRAPERMEM